MKPSVKPAAHLRVEWLPTMPWNECPRSRGNGAHLPWNAQILKCETWGLAPKVQGNHAEGKLAPFSGWVRDRLALKGDLTLDEIVAEMAAVHGVSVHRGPVGRWLHRLGLSHKKNAARQRDSAPRDRRAAMALG